MDTGDSNFSQPSSNFILLPSQEETQQESQEDAMRRMLTTLPALQAPRSPARSAATSLLSELGETSTEEDNRKVRSKVLVTDSEMEQPQNGRSAVEESDVTISESVEESEENAEVTVIEKKTKDDSDVIADTEISSSSPNQPASPVEPDRSGQEDELLGNGSRSQSSSSFQSKDRSNLGSYDQCEVFGTQQRGHAHGQRFKLFQSSQEDVFGDNDVDDDDDFVSTPAEHIGSLQLSAKPMLVPETVDEMESEVPLTPPHMIPASPTDQEMTEEEPLYNINEANTLADHSKGFNYSGSSSSSKGSGDKTVIERQPMPSSDQELARVTPTEDQDFVMRPGPTLAGGSTQQDQEDLESLHLHLSASHPSESSCNPQIVSPERNSESPEVIEYVTETPKKMPSTKASSSSEIDERLLEDQSESRIVRISTPRMKAPPTLPKEVTRTPEDVIIIDSGTGDVVEVEEDEEISLHLSPSEEEITQRKNKSSASSKKSTKGKKSKREKRETDIPIVVWKDNVELELTDTEKETQDASETNKETPGTMETNKSSSGDRLSDEFHLTLPKTGDLLHPAKERQVAMETEENIYVLDETKQQSEDRVEESENIAIKSVEHPKSPTLTLSMIQADSEAASEDVFRLEKPQMQPADVEVSEEMEQEDIFRRAKVKQMRQHWKYIQDEDSDDEYISPRQPQTLTPSAFDQGTRDGKTAGTDRVSVEAEQQEIIQTAPQPEDSTMSYDVDAVSVSEQHKNPVQHESEMEVLEAFPLEPTEGKTSTTVEPSMQHAEVEKSAEVYARDTIVDHQEPEVMKPPSTPVMSQDRTLERPKTPASVQNILKAYSDIIYKKTPLRQRSASIDVTHQESEVRTSLSRQFSHDVSVTQSGRLTPSHSKDQSQKLSQLLIQTQPSVSNGAPVLKGGSLSPKGGSASPKGGSWMSSRKPSSESLPDTETKQKKSGNVSPNSNPPKSPKGLDINDISHELLQSFRQSKKHRHHSGSHVNGKARNGDHGDSKSVHNNGNHGDESVQKGSGNHGDKKTSHVNGVSEHQETRPIHDNVIRTVTSAGVTPSSKSVILTPPSKQLSTQRATDSCNVTMSQSPIGIENQNLMSAVVSQGQVQNRTPLPHADTVITLQKTTPSVTYSEMKTGKKKEKKAKKLMSSAERMRRRTSVDSNTSAQATTGSFVNSTGKFLHKDTSIEPLSTTSGTQGQDPFTFQGSQSQREMRSASRLKKYTSSSFERTPVSTRKRKKVIYKKSGVKKQKVADFAGNPDRLTSKDVASEKVQSPTSLTSDITVTTVGSLQSIPSSISQASSQAAAGEAVLSPSSSSSKASTGGSGTSHRRLSIEPLPDTIPLQNEDDNYQRVTMVTTVTKRYTMETETKCQMINSEGKVLESSSKVQKGDPVVVEEKTHKKVQLIYMPSPSRSVSSLTSGDLADISSSMSRSGSSSLGSKMSSFEQSQRAERSDSGKSQGQKETSGTSQEERRTSEFLEPQPSTSRMPYELIRKDTLKSKPVTPDLTTKLPSTSVTPIVPASLVIPSDTDGSDVGTPLGSTINKTGSYLHSRSVSVESPRPVEVSKTKSSPKASDSLFSSTEERGGNHQEGVQTRRSSSGGTSESSLIPAGQKRLAPQPATTDTEKHKTSTGEATSSSDQISPEIPYQDQAISSSGTVENTALVPSTGEPGSRIIAKWKDGFYYPGVVKGKDRYGRFQVRFDDGDSMTVKTSDLLLVEKLPAGQSVLVQAEGGYFESGMIVHQKEREYMVEIDSGSRGLYSQSQVILTADQASCLITDKGSEIMIELPGQLQQPVNVGDVSLENLLDAPRRSAKKAGASETKVKEEEKGQGQGSRGRKRKLEPQATSTPTPKGKEESSSPKKRKIAATTGIVGSPLLGAMSSPVSARRSPRKARIGLFTVDLGPIPTKKLFRGMLFLLTNVDKTREQKKLERQLLQDSSLETSDESTAEEEVAVPFDKNQLKNQIEAGGGRVLENFDTEQIEASKKCYLLSSTYQRTIKYLQCLACGVICVAHSWITNSCKEDKLLDHKSYILPAGISLEKKKIMEWKSKTDVFVGVRAFVSSKNSKFCECWSEILRLAKCTVLPKLQYSELDVIVTDSSCTPATVRQAETHSVALVSTEWVIQTLINGKPMKYDGHPRYKYDFMI